MRADRLFADLEGEWPEGVYPTLDQYSAALSIVNTSHYNATGVVVNSYGLWSDSPGVYRTRELGYQHVEGPVFTCRRCGSQYLKGYECHQQ